MATTQDMSIPECVLPRAIAQITVFSQLNNKRFADFSLLADTCTVANLFTAVTSVCQGLKQVCQPGFVYIEEVFYYLGGNSALVPPEKLRTALPAE